MNAEAVEDTIEAVQNIERPDGLNRLSSAIRNVTNAA